MAVSMKKFLSASVIFWFFIALVGTYYIYNIRKYLNFGIDLVGGIYLTLEVQD